MRYFNKQAIQIDLTYLEPLFHLSIIFDVCLKVIWKGQLISEVNQVVSTVSTKGQLISEVNQVVSTVSTKTQNE